VVQCVNFSILEWHIAPSEAWKMSFREWMSLSDQKKRNHNKRQNRFDHETAEEFEAYIRSKGLIE
jgi:hypothetical protein